MAISKADMERLANLQQSLEAERTKVAELEKKLASSESSLKYANTKAAESNAELEAVHDVLDTLPGAPSKRHPDAYSDRKLMTRLAGYFAAGMKVQS